jgi:hypothetical protein
MARRTFVSNGITYSDTEAGYRKAHKDDWDIKLTRRGHKMRWRVVSKNGYRGRCTECGGEVSCGTWGSSSAGYDIRKRHCGKPGRLLQLIIGG